MKAYSTFLAIINCLLLFAMNECMSEKSHDVNVTMKKVRVSHNNMNVIPINMTSLQDKHCSPLPPTPSDKWILAESTRNGLCNQLFGIFSYIPVALVYGVNLIVGGIYCRHSFVKKLYGRQSVVSLVPFSEVFDFQHFRNYWLQQHVVVVESINYTACPNARPVTAVQRTKAIWPLKRAQLLEMLAASNISYPVPNRTIIDVVRGAVDNNEFIALFNFRRNQDFGKALLFQVHASLRPSRAVQQQIDAVRSMLPTDYVAIHLRLEGDFLQFTRSSFNDQKLLAINSTLHSKCFLRMKRVEGVFKRPPALFIASGLFFSPDKVTNEPRLERQAESVVRHFESLGFDRVYSRTSILYSLRKGVGDGTLNRQLSVAHQQHRTRNQQNNNGNNRGKRERDSSQLMERRLSQRRETRENRDSVRNTTSEIGQLKVRMSRETAKDIPRLLPEQEALVDLQLSRNSSCFVPSHVSSSFSYMALRFQYLDRGILQGELDVWGRGTDEFGPSRIFRLWGL